MGATPQDEFFPLAELLDRTESDERRSPARAIGEGPISDEEVLSRLAERDKSAFRLLFERYGRLVHSVAARILRDEGEAEELVQDVLLYVFQKAALFDPSKGAAKSWIVQIAYHRAFDRRSYLRRRSFYAGTDLADFHDTLAGDQDLEREVELKLTREGMRRAFAELSDKQRQTLELFFFEGLNFQEIAERMGEDQGNVRHYYYRGVEKLRKSNALRELRNKR